VLREITGFSNPLVKRVKSLREKKHRRQEGLFLAEGLRILTEALEAGIAPKMLWLSPEMKDHRLVQPLIEACDDSFLTSVDILSKLSGKDNPQAVLGVYQELNQPLATLDRNKADIWIVAERLRDPGNLGTILRTGDAIGAGGLILIDDCTDPFSVEAVRSSMGAIFTQAVVQSDWSSFVDWLRQGQAQLVGTSLNTDLDYTTPRYSKPTFLLVGNESQGLPADYEVECDLLVKMPMLGKADSLNAAVAISVMGYEVLNQHRA
jgi:RNA methyltransferase, TrmH family